jgi:hypothetical protein
MTSDSEVINESLEVNSCSHFSGLVHFEDGGSRFLQKRVTTCKPTRRHAPEHRNLYFRHTIGSNHDRI